MNGNHTAPTAPRLIERTKLILFWTFVGVPLGWGTWQVLVKSVALFAR